MILKIKANKTKSNDSVQGAMEKSLILLSQYWKNNNLRAPELLRILRAPKISSECVITLRYSSEFLSSFDAFTRSFWLE